MNKLLYIIILILFIVGGYWVLKNPQLSSNKSNKLAISASFYPMYFFSTQIGMEKADISNITPAGAEPHDYEPTSQQIAKIERSNMLVLNGGVEGWGSKIKDNLKGTKVLIVVAGEGLITQKVEEQGQNVIDPHVWLDPVLAKQEVAKITDGFVKVDSSNETFYKNNQKKLDDKLDQLDKDYKEGLKSCKNKDIITSHAAFGYLASRYGLRQVPIAGLSPDEEPSTQQLAQVAKFARDNNIKYIFFESLVSPKLSETIASEVGAKTMVLDPIEGISDDNIKQGKNYFTVMEDNLKNLRVALECK
ncbi:MAG TPA: zinc ABC transporter substrate-binding protein [Patescibacteria group bacterium]|nr:zinc ABC transporter substrate-binding protein [Patescibacteria group bacterium]